ncbi:pilus assembly PilX N-terminal domain-containing protein [Desulfobacula sp.]|uniref:pilus assembly PilX family protein n=1 Tax=Desulfobacula sp. TaxID=2593537 RepID=UPI002635E747|nr:pilus assembly PilX N-terminal domain-containing protein [Desulfobacula sp.]
MKEKPIFLNNEKGSVLVIAIIFLMLLTVIGIFATTTSTIEIQISGNDKINKMVFYAADSGTHYVAVNTDLYNTNNLDEDAPLSFPDPDDPGAKYSLSDKLQVNGNVTYLGKVQMPAGSGYSAGTIFAIIYELESSATGPNNGASTVEAGFYRIGL